MLKKKSKRREWIELGIILVLILALKSSIVTLYQIPTGSMIPTILPGDRVVADQRAFGWRVPFTHRWLTPPRAPERGDVVVFPSPVAKYDLIKRVVAVGGDTVEVKGERLFVNGSAVTWDGTPQPTEDGARQVVERHGDRAHITRLDDSTPQLRAFGPFTIPDGMFFPMGDNRDHSGDGRVFGPIPNDRLLGRAHYVVFAVNWDQFPYLSFSRSGKPLDRI